MARTGQGPGLRLFACAVLCTAASAIAAPAAGAAVVLNEVNCEGTDWVELVNTADTPADLSGWLVTDHPLDSTDDTHRLLLPPGTSIAAGDDLVIERATASSPAGFPFGISCGNDTVRLADGAGVLVDEIAVPALTSGVDTWGRYPNATGPWLQTLSTKGAPNEPSTATGGPPVDLAAWLFDPGSVVSIDLGLPQGSRDALAVDPTEYQDGTFSLATTGGTYGPYNVGIRLKGGLGSFRPLTGKAAFKVKFSHSVPGQRFLGLKTLTLNNMVQDRSMIHEVLAYTAFRAMDVAAPRTGYADVRVDGERYGLYLNVETLDDVFLPSWFDSTGHLYEGEYGMDVSPGGAGAFEVDEGSESDRTDLEALIAAANDDEGDWSEGLSAVADLEQMTRMWAVEHYIGHWDGYSGLKSPTTPNNFYLHSESSGLFSMLPWGTDQTWAERIPFDAVGGLLFERCLEDVSCAALYRTAVEQARTAIVALDLDTLAQTTAAAIAPAQALDPRRNYTLENIATAVQATRDFLAARPGDVDAWLAPPDEPPARPPAGRPADPLPVTGTPVVGAVRRGRGGVVHVPLSCPAAASACPAITVELLRRRIAMLGRKTVLLGPGDSRIARVRLNGRGRRLLRARGRLRVRVEVTAGVHVLANKRVQLRRMRR